VRSSPATAHATSLVARPNYLRVVSAHATARTRWNETRVHKRQCPSESRRPGSYGETRREGDCRRFRDVPKAALTIAEPIPLHCRNEKNLNFSRHRDAVLDLERGSGRGAAIRISSISLAGYSRSHETPLQSPGLGYILLCIHLRNSFTAGTTSRPSEITTAETGAGRASGVITTHRRSACVAVRG